MAKKKMRLKQQHFADEYIWLGDATKAAQNAGYSDKTVRFFEDENLTKPNIKSYIDERLAELQSKVVAGQWEFMEYLTSVMRGQVEDEELMVVPLGDFEGEMQRHEHCSGTSQRTKATDLLSKRYKLRMERKEFNHSCAVQSVNDIDV
ncbi:terminase small subunit [Salinicoccus roseus]|uniref:terminase small subunit n=1 Tax=Salinicoccus roseus TaxID=45670 RepID=UPI0035253C51